MGVIKRGQDFEHFSKKGYFLIFKLGKTNITTFVPLQKYFGKIS